METAEMNNIVVSSVMVQDHGEEYDRDSLNRPSFLVNMRLFEARPEYRKIVCDIINYMFSTLDIVYSDYGNGHESGVAAPTLGLPLSIIAYRVRGEKRAMINPQIIERSYSKILGKTNCGCCQLKNKIEVYRYEWITVRYFDTKGKLQIEEKIDRINGCLTIQHEIDHTIGFLITDRYFQQGHSVSEINCLRPNQRS